MVSSAALISEDLTSEALRLKVKALAEQVADPLHRLHKVRGRGQRQQV